MLENLTENKYPCHRCKEYSCGCKCLQHKCKFCEENPLHCDDDELDIIFSEIQQIYPHLGGIRKRNEVVEFGIKTFYGTLNWSCYHGLPIDTSEHLKEWIKI